MNAPVKIPGKPPWAVDAMGGSLLDRLAYLVRFGPELIVVSGDSEAGLSEIAAELGGRLPEAKLTTGIESARWETTAPDIRIVDRADTLSQEALLALRAPGARAILFGSRELAERLPDAHHESLPSLDESMARALLRRCFPGRAVSEDEVERTLRASGGRQAETARAFGAVLANDARPRIGLPVAHMAALIVVAGLIAVLILGVPDWTGSATVPVNLPVGLAQDTTQGSTAVAVDEQGAPAAAPPTAVWADPKPIELRVGEGRGPADQDLETTAGFEADAAQAEVVRLPRTPPITPAAVASVPEPSFVAPLPKSDTPELGAYALQLLALSDLEHARRFVRSRETMERYGIVAVDGISLVVYGRYADKPAARRAIEDLPADLRALGPWPRLLERSVEVQ